MKLMQTPFDMFSSFINETLVLVSFAQKCFVYFHVFEKLALASVSQHDNDYGAK